MQRSSAQTHPPDATPTLPHQPCPLNPKTSPGLLQPIPLAQLTPHRLAEAWSRRLSHNTHSGQVQAAIAAAFSPRDHNRHHQELRSCVDLGHH